MKEKVREVTLTESQMEDFVSEVTPYTSDGGIFTIIRNIEKEIIEKNVKIVNIGNLYWYLIDHRNKSKVS